MQKQSYTEQVIKGIAHTNMLSSGTALVLEGGGTRGYFSAGVFEAFMEEGIMFPYIIGVSAGAANALSYVSGQRERNRVLAKKYLCLKEYVSWRNLLKHKSYFGYDFIFSTVPEKHLFWDKEVFDNTDIRFLTGAIDCATGETIWFEKQEIAERFKVVRASCSIPMLSQAVNYNGYQLLDGGVSDPIPIEKSIEDGNNFHVIVLTRNQGYVCNAFKFKGLLNLFYRQYPRIIDAIMQRHEAYNRQLQICENLVSQGKAIILRPQQPLAVGRTTKDSAKLMALYDEGHDEGRKIIGMLKEFA